MSQPTDHEVRPERTSARRRPRRRALLVGAGAGVAGLAAGIYAGSRAPEVTFPQSSYGSAGPRLLVAYDSQFGSTAGIAQAIGQQLGTAARVDVSPIWQVDAISDYAAMVFGAPVQTDAMKRSATDWLRERAVEINRIPHAYFMPSATFGLDPDRESQTALKLGLMQDAAALTGTAPLALLPMGGVVDFSKMAFFTSVVYQLLSGSSTQGDFRDFDVLATWVDQIQAQLLP
ncbi:MAG: flavodoxin domain-containing protein [Beutenbergiaceae bacterium]